MGVVCLTVDQGLSYRNEACAPFHQSFLEQMELKIHEAVPALLSSSRPHANDPASD